MYKMGGAKWINASKKINLFKKKKYCKQVGLYQWRLQQGDQAEPSVIACRS